MKNPAEVMNMLSNQQSYALRKYAFEILNHRYEKYDDLVTRICSVLVTKNDAKDFAKFIAEIFECGFIKSFEENQKLMKGLGHDIKITSPPKENNAPKIFDEPEPEPPPTLFSD